MFPDGPPRRFKWRRSSHRIVRVEGPERIAMEWWRREPERAPEPDDDFAQSHPPQEDIVVEPIDGSALTRDYFRAEDEDGERSGFTAKASTSGKSDIPLVLARAVRMTRVCGDRRHHEFFVFARRIASAGICASGQQATACHAIGIADHNTLAGVVRAYNELGKSRKVRYKPKLLVGARLVFTDGTPDILVYPRDRPPMAGSASC